MSNEITLRFIVLNGGGGSMRLEGTPILGVIFRVLALRNIIVLYYDYRRKVSGALVEIGVLHTKKHLQFYNASSLTVLYCF